MGKIRVVHHSKTIGYAGTDRTAQLFVKYLNKLPDVEAFLVYRANDNIDRLEECKETIGEQYLIPYEHEHQPKAPPPYFPKSDNLTEVLADLKPDIFHIHRGGQPEWPGMKSICPDAKIVETNIFAGIDHSPDIDLHIYISNFIAVRARMLNGRPGPILMNPTEKPFVIDFDAARFNLRRKLGVPQDAIVLGRVGRPDNFDPIALKAFKVVHKNYPNTYYAVVNPCNRWREMVERDRISNVIFLPKIVNDVELSEFYAGLDIYAHARVDGECQPCNLNEAMYHGIPVVTHVADTYQGHVEQVRDSGAGLVAEKHQGLQYAGHIMGIIQNDIQRNRMSEAGIQWAKENVDAEAVTKKLVEIYEEVLA